MIAFDSVIARVGQVIDPAGIATGGGMSETESVDQEDGDASVLAAKRAVMDGLFSDEGRRDPHGVLRGAPIPGTRYAFVREVLHDRRFIAPPMPESRDLIFNS